MTVRCRRSLTAAATAAIIVLGAAAGFCAADLVWRLRLYTAAISNETELPGQLQLLPRDVPEQPPGEARLEHRLSGGRSQFQHAARGAHQSPGDHAPRMRTKMKRPTRSSCGSPMTRSSSARTSSWKTLVPLTSAPRKPGACANTFSRAGLCLRPTTGATGRESSSMSKSGWRCRRVSIQSWSCRSTIRFGTRCSM